MKTNKFISPFISCVVQNFPFIEESIDGLTQYELLCKIVEKLNAVITQTNTQTENIEKLKEAFTTLKNYVDNYFNNLDVQTEINNKLDEMATSGELEAIIASYLNTQAVRGFSTLNDLKNATGLITGAICQTSGKNTYKDGLGSLYRIRNITNEDVVDNDNLVAITSDVSLVAEKITNNISNTKTTGTTNTYSCDYINNTINSIVESGSNYIKFYDGTLVCWGSKTVTINITTSYGNMYRGTSAVSFDDYQKSFISIPTVIVYVNGANSSLIMNWSERTLNNPGEQMLVLPISKEGQTYVISYIAIGKWK